MKRYLVRNNCIKIKRLTNSFLFIKFLLKQRDYSKVIFFVTAQHVASLLKYHYPNIEVVRFDYYDLFKCRKEIIDVIRDYKLEINHENKQIYFFNQLSPELIFLIKTKFPNYRLFLRIHDKIIKKDINKQKKIIHQLVSSNIIEGVNTYCFQDSRALEINYLVNLVNIKRLKKDFFNSKIIYKFSFLAVEEGNRKEKLKIIKEKIFSINPNWEKNFFSFKGGNFLPYEKYLEILASSEIVIDLCRVVNEEGFSYRTPECLILNKKVITDRDFRSLSFYHKSRFFILGVDDFADLKNFIESPFLPMNETEILELDTSCFFKSSQWVLS